MPKRSAPTILLILIFSFLIFPPTIFARRAPISRLRPRSRNVLAKTSDTSPKPVAVRTTPKPTPVPIDEISAFLMSKINEYRSSKGLPPVKTDSYTCNFARLRASEISQNFSHDGFNSRISNKSLPFPKFAEVVENLAKTEDYVTVVEMWAKSAGQAANMEKNTPFGCVIKNGEYFAYEAWRP